MKQKDVALIIAVIGGSAMVAFIVSYFVFGSAKTRTTEVQVVPPISADFKALDKDYFGPQPIDPTQPADVGGQNNSNPF